MILIFLGLTLFAIVLLFLLESLRQSLKRLGHTQTLTLLRAKSAFLRWTLRSVLLDNNSEVFFRVLRVLQKIVYTALALCFFGYMRLALEQAQSPLLPMIASFLIVLFATFLADTLALLSAAISPKTAAKYFLPIAMFLGLLLSPFFIPFFFIGEWIYKRKTFPKQTPQREEFLREVLATCNFDFDPNDQKWIIKFVTFKQRIAKEIMIPRIGITAIDEATSLQKAAELFLEEGYSRIPAYKNTLDEITGVLLYKDLFHLYIKNKTVEAPVKSLIKPIIYAPENKKISDLLQEFCAKQLHFAVIVDEYGGTEGIVTIEDILEELVGEIEDEYDAPEKDLFWKLPNGSWVMDAKMSTIDVAVKTGISLPQSSKYETVGGYIFYKAGTIPLKGWSLHQDTFKIEVLKSSQRAVEKVRITPIPKKPT